MGDWARPPKKHISCADGMMKKKKYHIFLLNGPASAEKRGLPVRDVLKKCLIACTITVSI